MRNIIFILCLLFVLMFAFVLSAANNPGVIVSGTVTPGDSAYFVNNFTIKDSGIVVGTNAPANSVFGNPASISGLASFTGAPVLATSVTAPLFNATTTGIGYELNGVNGISYPSGDSTAGASIAIGYQALNSETVAGSATYQNTAIGYQAMAGTMTTSAYQNVALGYQALKSLTSGERNTAMGAQALSSVTSGSWNMAFGQGALGSTSGSSNIAIGQGAMWNSYSGDGNVVLGNNGCAGVSGNNNNCIGPVGQFTLTSGSNNILIGTSTSVDTPASGTSNFLNIGNVIFATGMTGTVASPAGNVGIGTTIIRNSAVLDVQGTINVNSVGIAAATTACYSTASGGVLSLCSSLREQKTGIEPLAYGLTEVMKMQPVSFNWKQDGSHDLGFIAEDIEAINPLFAEHSKGKLTGVKYRQITALLVRAIQQQQIEIEELKARLK